MKIRRAIWALSLIGLGIGGCQAFAPTSQPSGADEKQADVLAHPADYDPQVKHSVSTGSPFNDINDILNP